MYDVDAQALHAVVELELKLLGVPVRASARLVGELLDADFFEFDTSGRRRDLPSALAAHRPARVPDGSVRVADMAATLLAPGLVQVTYRSCDHGGSAWRSSLWRRTPAGWRRFFHQGTVIDGG
ncbi:nuclear transport factor 2 family protein [Streptomyces sp. NPDC127020]|uniref:nuclear transport factor 2 family protein n=1 Tax=Streptomyces sp. NPDC127020 TaxID=3347109 RepID=UPI003657CFB8